MDYCAAMNFVKNKSDFNGVFRTLFYPIKIDSYMEKNRIFEIIGELMIRAAIDRPCDIIDFLLKKLPEIANKFRRNIVTIEFNNCIEDASRMLKTFSCQSRTPIIENVNDDSRHFLMSSLRNHHFIVCDFKNTKSNREQMMKIKSNESDSLRCAKLCEKTLRQVLHDVRYSKPSKGIKFNLSLICKIYDFKFQFLLASGIDEF